MLKKISIIFLFCGAAFAQIKVSGKITDFNQNSIPNCHIHIDNQFQNSDKNGDFLVLVTQSKSEMKLRISALGFVTFDTILRTNKDLYLKIQLKPAVNQLDAVVMNQTHNTKQNSVREQKIDAALIEKYSSQTLGDALKEVSGVSVLKTGNNIVKPIINGLHSSRVSIINNNVRLEDQQWGTEHAPNFDLNSAGKITVVKGASGLEFGGDAVGGAVIIEPVVVQKDTLYGKTISSFDTNGRGTTLSSSLHKGNFCDWSWNTLATLKYYGDRQSADYVLSNTGNREFSFAGDVGYRFKNDNLKVSYSFYKANIGILSASHTGNINDLYNSINNQIPSIVEPFTYTINSPKQEVTHHLFTVKYQHDFSEKESINVQYAFQNNHRLEFDVRRGNYNNIAALDLQLYTNSINFDYKKSFDSFKLKSGLNASYQNNFANPETGIRPLIPTYDKTDFGLYAITDFQITPKSISDFGLRYDFSNLLASKNYLKTRWTERNYDQDFSEFVIGEEGTQWQTKPKFNFHNFSAATGIKTQFDDISVYANLSLSSRNPNVSELFSDGLHHATGNIEFGDLRLKREQSLKFSTRFFKKTKRFSVDINPYLNLIKDFIYLKPTGFETTIRGAFPVWEYMQSNVLMAGLDLQTQIELTDNWRYSLSYSYLYAQNRATNEPLIAMPPQNIVQKIIYQTKSFYELNFELKNELVLHQNRYPNYNFVTNIIENNQLQPVLIDISTPPPAYTLWSLYGAIKPSIFKKIKSTIAVSIQNMFNAKYRDYLNQQRFYADELGRNIQIQLKLSY